MGNLPPVLLYQNDQKPNRKGLTQARSPHPSHLEVPGSALTNKMRARHLRQMHTGERRERSIMAPSLCQRFSGDTTPTRRTLYHALSQAQKNVCVSSGKPYRVSTTFFCLVALVPCSCVRICLVDKRSMLEPTPTIRQMFRSDFREITQYMN